MYDLRVNFRCYLYTRKESTKDNLHFNVLNRGGDREVKRNPNLCFINKTLIKK